MPIKCIFFESASKILFKRMKHGGIIKDILIIPPWNNIAPWVMSIDLT